MGDNRGLQLVHDYINDVFPQHLEKAQEFLRIRSISADNVGLVEAAEWLNKYIQSCGGEVVLAGKSEAPIVYARIDVGQPKTLLVYGMYDVQSVAGQDWRSPPFGAEIHELEGVGPCIIARGACNSKGPLIGFLNALQAIRQVGELPVNIIFTIEGEEEIGSPTLPAFYRDNKNSLKADAGFDPFWAEYGTDVDKPTLPLGSKGILCLELICRGGEWGGPRDFPVHSSVAAWLASPLWRLVRALNTLVDENEEIAVPEILDHDLPLTQDDENILSALETTFDEASTLILLGASRYKYNLHGVDLLRKYFFSPCIIINQCPQESEDTVPSEARCQLTVRLAPGMDPNHTINEIRAHLIRAGYSDIEIVHLRSYPGSRTSIYNAVVQSMLETYRYHGHEPQIWPLLAGASPYYLFSDVLGIPYVSGGLGKAGGSHACDEFAAVEGLKLFETSIATFLHKFASAS